MVENEESFIATILKPGSSLNPTFLTILDGAFACLFLVLVVLALLTSGNLHVFVLLAIELSLWASVKWCELIHCGDVQMLIIGTTYNRFVNELKNMPRVDGQEGKEKNH
jgi:ER protein Pkr1